MASTGGRAPPGQNTLTPSARSHWPGAVCGSPTQRLDPVHAPRSLARLLAAISLGLPDPATQRLRRAADLGRDRADCRPLRATLPSALQHQPHRPVPNLKRVVRRGHRSIISTVAPPANPARFTVLSGSPTDRDRGRKISRQVIDQRAHCWRQTALRCEHEVDDPDLSMPSGQHTNQASGIQCPTTNTVRQ